jgi:uncharacterized protein (TIGR01777 family)
MHEERVIKAAVSGASGFVGGRLSGTAPDWLRIAPITREDLADTNALKDRLEGADAIVNLAGAPILARWTAKYRDTLYSSRIDTTRAIVDAARSLSRKPEALVSVSAIGIYGGDGPHTEDDHSQAEDFLGRLASDWEKEALRAEAAGIRTVILRLGVVLGKEGGAIKNMLTPFRLGLGGPIGDGSQPMSWVHMDDVTAVIRAAIQDNSYRGTYNLTSPNPVTNMEFTKALAGALKRPAFFRIPMLALRARFGQGASVLTQGQRVLPKRLLESGYEFRFLFVENAIKDCLA